jgi:CubicO group peptidase (beta-lactamase class C family)
MARGVIIYLSVLLALALTMTAWRPVGSAAAQTSPAPTEQDLKNILSEFEKYVTESMPDWSVPGLAVAVVQNDRVVYTKTFGLQKLGGSAMVNAETIFQIGSTTKAFTSTLVAMMVDEGRVGWRDKVIDHLPDFRMYDPWVTAEFEIQDLMAQRSGLPAESATSLPMFGFGRQAVTNALQYIQPVSSFRAEFAYQNSTFLWAAALVEKLTGQSWEQNLKERIFAPLGMKSAHASWEEYRKIHNSAVLHRWKNDETLTEVTPLSDHWPYHDWLSIIGPAGSISANINDMAQWLRLQLNQGVYDGKTLVSPGTLGYTQTPQTIIQAGLAGEQLFYCLGWVYNTYSPYPIVWHNGATLGAKSIVSMVPQAKVGLVVLTNLTGINLPEALHKKFYDLYFGNPVVDWNKIELDRVRAGADENNSTAPSPAALPARSLDLYTGLYKNQLCGLVRVEEKYGQLSLILGPKNVVIPLTEWDGDTFAAALPEYSNHVGFVGFRFGPEGQCEAIDLADLFDLGQAGPLKRFGDL